MADEKDVIEPEVKSSKMPIILVGALCAALGGVGGLFASDYIGGDETEEVATESATSSEMTEADTVPLDDADTLVYPLGDFSINLKDASTMRILQMSISVECENSVEGRLEKKKDEIRNAILMFTSEYTVDSLSGLEGKMDLRDEIQLRINAIAKPHRIERVYFTKFIIGK